MSNTSAPSAIPASAIYRAIMVNNLPVPGYFWFQDGKWLFKPENEKMPRPTEQQVQDFAAFNKLEAPAFEVAAVTMPAGEIPERQPVTAAGYTVTVFDPAMREAFIMPCEDGTDAPRNALHPGPAERDLVVNALCEALTAFGLRLQRPDGSIS